MSDTTNADQRYTLWGGQLSVYTAKVRSYMIKKRIPYRELYPSHPDFGSRVMPAIGLFVIPVMETPEGEFVQDTSDIIDYLEAHYPDPCLVPSTPVQRTVAALVNAYGSECLLQASMHYRWSFLAQHGDYIRTEFARATSASQDLEERMATAGPTIELMASYLPRLGIYEESVPAIEEAYEELLDVLNEHFRYHPYLLGGRPSMADFGMMAGLYAHLSRDPVPSALMKSRAPNVFRWTERMNVANIDDGEFPDAGDSYPPDDALPQTLEALLSLIFRDWGTELAAYSRHYAAWAAANPGLSAGDLVSDSGDRQVHPSLGPVSFEWRGITMKRNCAPQALWHFDRAAARARELQGDALARWQSLLERTGGKQMMALELARPMRRENNVLVLA